MSLRSIGFAAALSAALIAPASGADRKADKPQLRIVCVSTLEENQKVVLASRDDAGKFKKLGEIELRPMLVTDWLPAQSGELHLAVAEKGEVKSLGHFTWPAGTARAFVAVSADPEKKSYTTAIIDPKEQKFDKGMVSLCNFSPKTVSIALGDKEVKVEGGQQSVAKPAADEQGMYRLTVSILEGEEEPKMYYDRQVSGNPASRDLLFVLPDESGGIQVLSLPVFGDLEE
jgi:hypothetical protein